jgi:membrane-associated phospholipid phosphatase
VARWTSPHVVLLLTVLLGGGLAVALTAASAEVYEAVVDADGLAALDKPALRLSQALRSAELNAAMTAFTHLGGQLGMSILAGCATLALAVFRRSWTPLLLMAVASGGSLLMTVAGKDAAGRLRPPLEAAVPPFESSPSFPSGHSLNAVVIAGVIAYFLILRQKRLDSRLFTAAGAVAFALVMGVSRVYLGHHWLTDVVMAWTLGAAWLAVVLTVHRLMLTFRARHGEGAPGR